jgi:prepilin-type N-terminal cleavage/methylation domain-containing protein
MHKVAKFNKRGFSLLELIIVIAMIVVLAAVLAINAGDIYRRAQNKSDDVTRSATAVRTGINASEDKLRNDYHF